MKVMMKEDGRGLREERKHKTMKLFCSANRNYTEQMNKKNWTQLDECIYQKVGDGAVEG